MNLKKMALIALAILPGLSHAAFIPSGIQTKVSKGQIASWGWTECARSSTVPFSPSTSTASVLAACQGKYLAMGAWDASLGAYGAVGIGERSVVTAITYQDYFGDDAGTVQNWSNGLNWYRTAKWGAWGFTTSAQTALNVADVNLSDGLNNRDDIGTAEVNLAAGLSLTLNGFGNLHEGWAYNTDGNHHTLLYSPGDERVFWVANDANGVVPEPATLGMLGLGLAGLAAARRRGRPG